MNNLFIVNLILPLLALLGSLPLIFYDLYRLFAVRGAVGRNQKLLAQKKKQTEVLHNLFKEAFVDEPEEIRVNRLMDDLEHKLGWKALAYWDFLEDEQVIVIKNMRGLPQKFRDFVKEYYNDRLEVGSVAGGRAIATKQPVVSNDWNSDPQLRHLPFLSDYGHIASFAAFPVVSSLRTWGSLHVYGTKIGRFSLNEVQFFTTIANSLAAILEHRELKARGGEKNVNDIGES